MVVIDGVERKAHYLAMDLPQSDDCFVMAFPAETTEAFLEWHVRAFEWFGGVPQLWRARHKRGVPRRNSKARMWQSIQFVRCCPCAAYAKV